MGTGVEYRLYYKSLRSEILFEMIKYVINEQIKYVNITVLYKKVKKIVTTFMCCMKIEIRILGCMLKKKLKNYCFFAIFFFVSTIKNILIIAKNISRAL